MNLDHHARRRRELMDLMSGGIAVLPTAPVRKRNRDVDYAFRPDSDFHYLTSFPEPDAIAVLVPGREQGEYLLFCREKDPLKEIWNGRRAGLEGACAHYGADDAFPIEDIGEIMPGLLENRGKLFCTMGQFAEFDQQVLSWVNEVRGKARAGVSAPAEFIDLSHLLHEMRLVKRAEEIKSMRHAGRISVAAHRRAMQRCRPGMKEYEIQAELEYEFRRGGGDALPAYPSIVAGGANACILHYTENDAELRDGDLLLIDAGAEVDYYAADITRTFPVNGRFSAEQRAVYDVVFSAQRAAIATVAAGGHWNDPHDAAVKVLVEGLIDLGLLKGERDGLIESGGYKKFYMHRTGHWLGMDVHDVGDYKIDEQWRELEPGMTLTVEPGLYISAGGEGVHERWWDIGVRIEDDVLVTRNGAEILSAGLPTEAEELEALMGSR